MFNKIILSFMAVIALFLVQADQSLSAQKIKGKVLITSDNETSCKANEDLMVQKVCSLVFNTKEKRHLIFVEGKANGINFENGQAVILRSKSFGKTKAKIIRILRANDDLKENFFENMKIIILWHVSDDCYLVLDTSKEIEVPAGDNIKMKVKTKSHQKVEGC